MGFAVVSSLQLNFFVIKQFTSKHQVQNLSHKVCFSFSFWKLYKESICFPSSHSKYKPCGMNQLKGLTQKKLKVYTYPLPTLHP